MQLATWSVARIKLSQPKAMVRGPFWVQSLQPPTAQAKSKIFRLPLDQDATTPQAEQGNNGQDPSRITSTFCEFNVILKACTSKCTKYSFSSASAAVQCFQCVGEVKTTKKEQATHANRGLKYSCFIFKVPLILTHAMQVLISP